MKVCKACVLLWTQICTRIGNQVGILSSPAAVMINDLSRKPASFFIGFCRAVVTPQRMGQYGLSYGWNQRCFAAYGS